MAERKILRIFLSHSSAQAALAKRVEQALEAAGLRVWLDRSDIQLGTLLRAELHDQIKQSRVLLLLWSKAAARTRWVLAELLTAFHEQRLIVPLVTDATPLPCFLQNSVFVSFQKKRESTLRELPGALLRAPHGQNAIPPFRDAPTPEVTLARLTLGLGQRSVTNALATSDLVSARQLQKALDARQRSAERKFRFDAQVLNLGGYHRKNAYVLKHWDAIQAGRAPKSDASLRKAEKLFLDSLLVNPEEPSALNGFGNVLLFERDLGAAEFFTEKALLQAKRKGFDYEEAEHDLALIRRLKNQ